MKEDQIRNLQVLLQRLDIVRDKITARNEGKEKFNVFTCLMDSSEEVNLHSRFISSLLDPQGNHGLGFAPIDIILKTLDSSFQYNQETIEVIPSFSNWSEYKEIDILLIDRKTLRISTPLVLVMHHVPLRFHEETAHLHSPLHSMQYHFLQKYQAHVLYYYVAFYRWLLLHQ